MKELANLLLYSKTLQNLRNTLFSCFKSYMIKTNVLEIQLGISALHNLQFLLISLSLIVLSFQTKPSRWLIGTFSSYFFSEPVHATLSFFHHWHFTSPLQFKHHFLANAIPNHSLWQRFFCLHSDSTRFLSFIYTYNLIFNYKLISCHRSQVPNEWMNESGI